MSSTINRVNEKSRTVRTRKKDMKGAGRLLHVGLSFSKPWRQGEENQHSYSSSSLDQPPRRDHSSQGLLLSFPSWKWIRELILQLNPFQEEAKTDKPLPGDHSAGALIVFVWPADNDRQAVTKDLTSPSQILSPVESGNRERCRMLFSWNWPIFYNLQLFYWHFLEILWLFIFLVFYSQSHEHFLKIKIELVERVMNVETLSTWKRLTLGSPPSKVLLGCCWRTWCRMPLGILSSPPPGRSVDGRRRKIRIPRFKGFHGLCLAVFRNKPWTLLY